MNPILFPDPRYFPGIDGVVYVGGDLSNKNLYDAYSLGIFPWPVEGYPMLWHCPEERGVLFFSKIHIGKSLRKILKKNIYTFSTNKRFTEVITHCAQQKRKNQQGTWILPNFIPSYTKFHEAGYAHSIECWHGGNLVGGLYGVCVQGVFSGESMFNLEPDIAKLCLHFLVEKLKVIGFQWIDIQMVTPLTKSMGGEYIARNVYLDLLAKRKVEVPQLDKIQFS